MKHKLMGTVASSTVTIPNNGVTKITAAATYALAAPEVGSLVTIYTVGADAVVTCTSTVVGSTGQVAFNNAGGTQRLTLNFDSTVGADASVTLLGESSTQWRIINAWPPVSSNAGVAVTTS